MAVQNAEDLFPVETPKAEDLFPEPKTALGGFQPQGIPQENVGNAILNASGVAGPIKTAVDLLKNRPTAQKALLSGGAMAAASIPATAALAPMVSAGAITSPEAVPVIAGGAAAVGGANALAGFVSDIADNPERAHIAMKILFDPSKPIYQTLVEQAQKDPQGAIQFAKQELMKSGERFTSGAVAQLFSLGLGPVVHEMAGLIPKAVSAASDVFPSIRRAVQSKFTPIEGAQDALQAGGYETDASMYSKGRLVDVLKGLQTKGLFSADIAAKMVERNAVKSSQQLNDLTSEMAGGLQEQVPPSELAKMIVGPKQEIGEPLQKIVSAKLYNEVSDAVSGPKETFFQSDPTNPAGTPVPVEMRRGGAPVSTAGLKTIGAKISATMSELRNLPGAFSDNIKSALTSINTLPEKLSFEDAHIARSSLLDAIRESTNPTLVSLAKQGSAALDESMEMAAKNAGPEAYAKWRGANDFYRAGKQTFNNDLTAKLMITDPGQATAIGRRLLSNGNTEQINQLKLVAQRVQDLVDNHPEEAMKLTANNPNAAAMIVNGAYKYENQMNLMRRGNLDDLFAPYRSIDPNALSGEKINYQGVLNEIDSKQNPEGHAVLKTLHGQEGIDAIKTWATNGYRAAQTNPGAFDRTILFMSKVVGGAIGAGAGALVGHPWLGMAAGDATALFGEGKIASYLLSNPESKPLFIKGMELMGKKETVQQGSDMMIRAAKKWADNEMANKGK